MAQPCDQLLPQFGTGYRGYKSDNTRYGTAFTVNLILQLGVEWHALKPTGPRLLIGDISPKGGGQCPNGGKDARGNPTFHKSHNGGWDFDVQLVRADGQELVRSVKITDSKFDIGPTQQLVTLLEKLAKGHIRFIFTAEPKKLAGEHVHLEKEHVYHLHVRLLE
jgi:murein endopeptidase